MSELALGNGPSNSPATGVTPPYGNTSQRGRARQNPPTTPTPLDPVYSATMPTPASDFQRDRKKQDNREDSQGDSQSTIVPFDVADPTTVAGLTFDPKRAEQADRHERAITLKSALAEDWRVIAFCLIYSGTIIMEGYGLAIIFLQFSNQAFNKVYGHNVATPGNAPHFELSSEWYLGIGLCSILGPLVGVLAASPLVNLAGYKLVTLISLLLSCAFVAIPYTAGTIEVLAGGIFLQCIPWGVYQVVSPAFISEVSCLRLRPVLTTWSNLCWVLGQTIAAGVALGFASNPTEKSFRTPFSLNWPMVLALFIGMLFAPESPSWLLRKGKMDRARKAAEKLWGYGELAGQKLDLMLATIHHEEQIAEQEIDAEAQGPHQRRLCKGKFRLDVFSGTDRRRTMIVCLTWFFQTASGHSLTSWAVKLFENAGLSAQQAYLINFATPVLGLVGTVAAWWLMQKAGRRPMYFWGLIGQGLLLVAVGCTGFVADKQTAGWAAGCLIAIFTLVYDLTLGPVCYTIVSEIPSLRLRAPSLGLARSVYIIGNLLNQVVSAQVLHVERLNWGGKTAFIYAVMCVVGAVFTWFCIPETKDMTTAEIDTAFQRKVAADKFHAAR